MFKRLTDKLTVSFHIRSQEKQGEAMLYARLYYNGERTTEYRVGYYVAINLWYRRALPDQANDPEVKKLHLLLAQIRNQHDHIRISMQLQTEPIAISAAAIKERWCQENIPQKKAKSTLNHPNPKATLLDTYEDYLTHLNSRPKGERLTEKTRNHYRVAGQHLKRFLVGRKQERFLAESVTPGFGMQLYDYMREQGLNADTANRYINFIKAGLQYAVLYDRIHTNGLFQFKPPKGNPAKRIVFLSESALANLEALSLSGIRNRVRNWTLFMCYTGLDYHDAVAIVKQEQRYRQSTPDGDKWVYQRLKYAHAPQWGECHIPILPKAQELLRLLTKERMPPRLKVINTHLKEIAHRLALPFALCSKVCRKTAGVVFLREGYSMQSIQKILGHRSLQMTEKHYLSIQSFVVDADMAKIHRSQSSIHSFKGFSIA